MKKIIFAAVGIFSASVFGAEKVDGSYNTTLGYQAGLGSDGTRVTYMGAAAGAKSFGNQKTEFVGAAAGYDTQSLLDCVGLGYRAMRKGYNNADCIAIGVGAMGGSSNCQEVVAIGTSAFAGMSDLVQATWINNHFFASAMANEFWLRTNRNVAPEDSPIHYADGVLSLNAATVKINGKTTTGGEAEDVVDTKLLGFDYYVDPVNGNDLQDGKSHGSPKRTIDAVYALVNSNDVTICLLPGVHTSPSGVFSDKDVVPAYRIAIIAPYGSSRTTIDGGGVRCLNAAETLYTTVRGCTLRNFRCIGNGIPLYYALHFVDCAIEVSYDGTPEPRGNAFQQCVIERCVVNGKWAVTTGHQGYSIHGSMFFKTDSFDSVFDVQTPMENVNKPRFANSGYFRNCFIKFDKGVHYFEHPSSLSTLGNSHGYDECTIICPFAERSFAVGNAVGCLLGLGDLTNSVPTYGTVTGSVCTNAETIASIIEDDYRPSLREWRFRYAGYESAAERGVKNSMENAILGALLTNESLSLTPAASMGLLSVIQENEEVDAPREVNTDVSAPENAIAPRFTEEEEE